MVRAAATAVLLGAVAVASLAATPTGAPTAASAGPSRAASGSASMTSPTSPFAATPATDPASRRVDAHWGAIAARPDGYGYAFNQPSRAAAEQVARAQCERPAGSPTMPGAAGAQGSSPPSVGKPAGASAGGACEVRVWFERRCGALATGNFGEWGAAAGADKAAATKAAVAQCDAHLPTEPCRVVVSVCSLP
jgi:hypothetical protein